MPVLVCAPQLEPRTGGSAWRLAHTSARLTRPLCSHVRSAHTSALLTSPLCSHVRSAHTSALFESFSVWGSLMGMQPTRARRPWHRLGRRPSPNRCERHSRQPTSSTLTVRPSPLYLDRPSPCMLARATCHQLAPQAHRHAMNAPCERASACGTLSLASRERALAQTYVPSAAARPCACSAQPGAARARDGELGGRRRLRGAQGEG